MNGELRAYPVCVHLKRRVVCAGVSSTKPTAPQPSAPASPPPGAPAPSSEAIKQGECGGCWLSARGSVSPVCDIAVPCGARWWHAGWQHAKRQIPSGAICNHTAEYHSWFDECHRGECRAGRKRPSTGFAWRCDGTHYRRPTRDCPEAARTVAASAPTIWPARWNIRGSKESVVVLSSRSTKSEARGTHASVAS